MVLKVDLQCPSCYRKIKKVLTKFLQIRNQAYDEKQNTVTITVICCNPEKIRDKLCCKGGKTIKSIEIKPPPKPKEPEKPKVPEKPTEPKKGPDISTVTDKPHDPDQPKELKKSKPPPPAPASAPAPPIYVPIYPAPVCCGQCYEGIPGGPCYEGYGRPVPSYDGYGYGGNRASYGVSPSYDGYGYGGNRASYGVSRCDEYFNEENTSGCKIM